MYNFLINEEPADHVYGMYISHIRAILGEACRRVAKTGEPLGIWRYRRMDVVIVPLVEWRRLKALEAQMKLDNEKDPGAVPRSEGGRDNDVSR